MFDPDWLDKKLEAISNRIDALLALSQVGAKLAADERISHATLGVIFRFGCPSPELEAHLQERAWLVTEELHRELEEAVSALLTESFEVSVLGTRLRVSVKREAWLRVAEALKAVMDARAKPVEWSPYASAPDGGQG